MITSSKLYPFGGKVSTVAPRNNPHGVEWWISTAKKGLFSKQSTRFYTVTQKARFIQGSFKYSDEVTPEERLQFHDFLTAELDKLVDSRAPLSICLDPILRKLKKRNIGIGLRDGREIDTEGYLSDDVYVTNKDGTWSLQQKT